MSKRGSQPERSTNVPAGNYELLAKVLAEAVAAHDELGTVGSRLATMARQTGQARVSGTGVIHALCGWGYEPARTAGGDIELGNCPFHQLARQYPALVCGLNLQLIQGMLEATGESERAVPVRREGHCCVVVRAPQSRRTEPLCPRAKAPPQPAKAVLRDATGCATGEETREEPVGNARLAVPGDAIRRAESRDYRL
ncbi:hypothetical protein [Mycobacterium sp.]|uniref:hypothetical protein n=1 Tax=Mycobacterium sp. TaxID=1785 RepID=UPI003D6B548C